MDNTSHRDRLRDYYLNSKGTQYRSFEISIGSFHHRYDIYWGDPEIVFDAKALPQDFPLAVTIISHRLNDPEPRIYLHQELRQEQTRVFQLIVAHEIGHIWLHDVLGFNNPSTGIPMDESESEIWADYFSYRYLERNKSVAGLEDYAKILREASDLQLKVYNLDPMKHIEGTFTRKVERLRARMELVDLECKNGNPTIAHMAKAIETTLNALGNVFQ